MEVTIKTFTFFIALSILSSHGIFAQWIQTNGPSSAYVQALAYNAGSLFAGTERGVFVSTNYGDSWSTMNLGLTDTIVSSIATLDGNIFVGTGGGVFRSTDNGISWTSCGEIPHESITCLVSKDNLLFAGTSPPVHGAGGVYLSSDYGTTWICSFDNEAHFWILSMAADESCLVVGSGDCNGLILSSDNGISWTFANNAWIRSAVRSIAFIGENIIAGTDLGVVRSFDHGKTWKPINNELNGVGVPALLNIGKNLFAGTEDGVFLSVDQGTSWSSVSTGLPNSGILSFKVLGNELYTGVRNAGVWRRALSEMIVLSVSKPIIDFGSVAIGNTYQDSVIIYNIGTESLVLDSVYLECPGISTEGVCSQIPPGDSCKITVRYVPEMGGEKECGIILGFNNNTVRVGVCILAEVHSSSDWELTNLKGVPIRDIAVGNNTLFAVTADSGSVYRSTDGGILWGLVLQSEVRNFFLYGVSHIAVSQNGTVLVNKRGCPGTDTLFRSTDNGLSWTACIFHQICDGSMVLKVGPNGTIFYAVSTDGPTIIYRSTNEGLTWNSNEYDGHITGLAYFRNGNILSCGYRYVWNYRGPVGQLSTDDGLTWASLDNVPWVWDAFAIDLNDNIFIGGERSYASPYLFGLFRSNDLYASWTKISDISPNNILPLPDEKIMISTEEQGVFISTDEGNTWLTFNTGLTNLNVHTLAMDSLGYVYAGTDSGIFRCVIPSILRTNITVNQSWNLVSVPKIQNSYLKNHIFPSSISKAYHYNNSYEERDTLEQHAGYWLKFPYSHNILIIGTPIECDTFCLTAGWNLIGSITNPVATTSITSIPGGIVTSEFYGYNNNYFVTSTIEAGKGYWVKVNQEGSLILSTSTEKNIVARIKIVPTSEQPPPAPTGEISDIKSQIPNKYALEQNYPNPFNPVTIINYQLPVDSWVTIKVFNILGQEVTTLVNEEQSAGYKSVKFDGTNLPSGVYFYKIQAGGYVFNKKLLLLK